MSRSEDNLQESVSFQDPRNGIKWSSLTANSFTHGIIFFAIFPLNYDETHTYHFSQFKMCSP